MCKRSETKLYTQDKRFHHLSEKSKYKLAWLIKFYTYNPLDVWTSISDHLRVNSGYRRVLLFLGTGSCPWPPQGWQRLIRRRPIPIPFIGPHSSIASTMYWLQDGLNRQLAPSIGDKVIWYNLIGQMKSFLNIAKTYNSRCDYRVEKWYTLCAFCPFEYPWCFADHHTIQEGHHWRYYIFWHSSHQ